MRRAGTTWIMIIPILFIATGCPSSSSSDDSVGVQLSRALDTIRILKSEVALEAGNNAIALRGFQAARPGDFVIRCDVDDSILSGGDNLLEQIGEDPEDNVDIIDVASLAVNLEWKREFQESLNTGLDFLDVSLRAAFERSEVERVEVSLSITNPQLIELIEPSEKLMSYELQNDCIQGNAMVVGAVVGQLRLEYEAYNRREERAELSAEFLVDTINALPEIGGEYVEVVEGRIQVVQESPESGSVIAVTMFPISESIQDDEFVETQLMEFCDNFDGDQAFRSFLVDNPDNLEPLAE